jgi:lipopolysaccharide export LptBFGC system permease protein LptF
MPRLLYRYVLRDLLRSMLLTTAILVAVVAFGAAVKPLINDRLLTPLAAVKYILLAMVPMLQFALPFSAGFAATITIHRMAGDNEIQAMAVSGVSYRRILRPVLVLGLLLLVVMIALTQWVIPRFWGLMQRTITADITEIFESSIRRGEPFEAGSLQIYADDVIVQHHPPGSEADTRMILVGVAAAELDRQLRIVTDVTASQAVVDVYRRPDGTRLKLALSDTVAFSRRTSQLVRTEQIIPDRALIVPDATEDEPTTMTQRQLRALYRDPDRFRDVVEAREQLAATLRDEAMLEAVHGQLAATGSALFEDDAMEGRRFRVLADTIGGGQFRRVGGTPVEVVEEDQAGPARRYRAAEVIVEPPGISSLGRSTFQLVLQDYEVTDLRSQSPSNRRVRLVLPGLTPAGMPHTPAGIASSSALIEQARSARWQPGLIKARLDRLEDQITQIRDEIVSRLSKRYAVSVTAPLLLVLGAVLAMWLRGSLPLTIYLLAFIPSILDLVLISGGDQVLREGKASGWLVMWSGNAGLLVLLLLAYGRLCRN